MPRAIASRLTGGGVISRPRPAGLSGWHTTATTSATSVSAPRMGTANAGVPRNTARGRALIAANELDSRVLRGALFHLAIHHPSLEQRDVIDHEHTVEMVVLVLHRDAEQS